MADTMINPGKGRAVELYRNIKDNTRVNAAFIVVLLKASEADAVLEDYLTLDALLVAAGNTEANFTNYARKTLDDTALAAFPAPNNTTNKYEITFPDQVYTDAGGALNNTMTKLLLCYDDDTTGGTDVNIVPIGAYDYAGVTDGSTITIQFPADAFNAA